MAHLSENSLPIDIVNRHDFLKQTESASPNVEFIHLPYYTHLGSHLDRSTLYKKIEDFINHSHNESMIAILTSPLCATDFLSNMHEGIYLKLWISVKLSSPIKRPGTFDQNHAALVLLSKDARKLQHTKTRISYSYCPGPVAKISP